MLKKETIKRLKELGIDAKALQAAMVDDNEVDITMPEGKLYKDDDGEFFTKDELSRRDKAKFEDGKKAMEEIAVKEIKDAKGYDFKGKKIENLVEHLEGKNDSDGTIKKLRENLTAAEKKALDAEERAGRIEHQSKVHSLIPEYKGYSKKELNAIAEANGYEVKNDNGKLKLYKDGVLKLDEKTAEPLDPAAGLKDFFEKEKKMSNEPGEPEARKGGGGGNSKTRTGKDVYEKASEVRKAYIEANPGKSVNGEDFFPFMDAATKTAKEAGKELIYD